MEQLLFLALALLIGIVNYFVRLRRSRVDAPGAPANAGGEPAAPPPGPPMTPSPVRHPPVLFPPRVPHRLDEDGMAVAEPAPPRRERHRDVGPALSPAEVSHAPSVPVPMAARLRGAGVLREAIVLRTILGPCRGIEHLDPPHRSQRRPDL